ncbi:MAG: hypothetical protein LBD44_00170 [Spirochaetaceae bacterium]|jgi:hypothetical protein|nr:hypothetical protein [Spirochaetaceae bacterium]
MKKHISILDSVERLRNKNRGIIALALVLLAPFVFAEEFTLQGAMETVFVPLQTQTGGGGDDASQTGLGIFGYSPNGGARFKLMADASHDRIGMRSYLRFYTSGVENRLDTIWLGVWVKPLDWLRFDVGSIEDWTLWGSFGQQSFAPYTQRSKDEDAIFTEFYYPSGVLLTARPIENLFIGVGVPALKSKPVSTQPSYTLSMEDAEKAYERIQAAVGYTFEGVGLARFQYVGANPEAKITLDEGTPPESFIPSVSSYAKFEGAFAYNGTPGLLVDIGFKIPVAFEQDDAEILAPYQISGGAKAGIGKITIEGRVDTLFGSVIKPSPSVDDKIKFAPQVNFHLTPSYKTDSSFTIGLDFGLESYGETTDKNGNVIQGMNGGTRGGIGAFVRKDFAPGSYVIGGLGYHFGGELNSVDQKSVFTIPIIFNYTSPKASLLPK